MTERAQDAQVQESAASGDEALNSSDARHEDVPARLAPQADLLSDAKRYRKRAQAAEKALEELNSDLAAREKTIQEQQGTIAALERKQRIDELLLDADAIDLEAARLLTEMAVTQMQEPDAKLAVDELRRSKPWLFRAAPVRRARLSGTMSPGSGAETSPHQERLTHAAAEAHATGNRTDLLRYLRLRRKR